MMPIRKIIVFPFELVLMVLVFVTTLVGLLCQAIAGDGREM